ncbi:transposase [Cucumis melo var. makuwa]|uniref:Transposase n=1 Tax=Cucumis melo var. makuwa TaxID=1194695 RepID=A0A5A7TV61_CUCMM|nr:transposase [Cucumis melo var. makuwa]
MIFSCGKKCGKNNNKGGNDYWKRRSDFFELPYWKNLQVRHCLDVMHIEKNVCMNIVGTLLDLPGKSKDGMNSRLDLVEMNIRPELAPMVTELDALQEDIVMTLCNLEKNRPEGCIAEAQVCEEAVHFCSDFLSGLDEIGLGSLNSREEKQIDRPLSAGTYSVRIDDLHLTLGDLSQIGHSSDFFIIATHGQQVFYVSDPVDPRWSVVVRPPQKDFSYKCANDDLGDMLPHYPSVSKWNSTSGIDESGDAYTRLDCEGTWVTT